MSRQFISRLLQVSSFRSLLEAKTPTIAAFKPTLFTSRSLCSKYYSNKKIIKPSVIPVTKGNAHLEIKLFDEKDAEIGVMNMSQAQKISKERELKLVMVDEEQKPPKFRLMNGSELVAAQMKKRLEKKASKETPHELVEKEVQLSLKTSDNDMSYKIKHVEEYYEKGHSIRIQIKSNLKKEEADNLELLQKEVIDKIKVSLKAIPSLVVKKRDAKVIVLSIPSRLHLESAKK